MFFIPESYIEALLEEDIAIFDLTTQAMKIEEKAGSISCYPKKTCVVAGVEEAKRLFQLAGGAAEITAPSGSRLEGGKACLIVHGTAGQLHAAYKAAQNVMEYCSGIATRCAEMVENARKVSPYIEISVTRKHFPGGKLLSLKAALVGGASIHRLGLADSILVFDQHRVFTGGLAGFTGMVAKMAAENPEKKIAAEANSPEEALSYARIGVDIIQCERFSSDILKKTVQELRNINPRIIISVAGGINAGNSAEYAATGVDILVTSWPYFGKPQDIKMEFAAVC